MPWIIPGIITSYLTGSIPTAYIFCRLLKNVDIRKSGSGNVGATNASRVLGKPAAVIILLIDIFKGFAAVFFIGDMVVSRYAGLPDITTRALLGLCCICGHNWTIFLRFKGGKGVATTLGVLLGLAFKAAGLKIVFSLTIAAWLAVFILFRIVSLASIISAVALPFFMLALRQPLALVYSSVLLSIFILVRHKSNLERLFRGEEPRLK
ncbi:MAG: glycerol-3-phosphate 1-O-acyltransferase PlsY [Candidatus Omnitrophica bacterium]|nr:glycerol-3-phosphate 1-O-acyltransferase PlsY [Candidatus Omnitrophota bacterium]MDD5553566.1 glycerol-3-phosphate 1-O-acyltransferase PlsY [Candidatus Omnitrophota bacterium]